MANETYDHRARLHVGHFDEFLGERSILIIGPGPAHGYLSSDILRLQHEVERPLEITGQSYVIVHGDLQLTARCVSSKAARGLVRSPTGGGEAFDWLLDAEMCAEISEKIAHLATTGPGHQYLGVTATEDAIVVASRNEYDPTVFDSK